ncbi:MAG TPA: dihydrofolate reductase family protein [Polyangiaceae bacterium]|nr:dihydrofolate reductase family protein [Polyangiaceae bacterium]
MRKIVLFDRVSADGSFSGPGGDLSWAVPDDELDAAGAAGARSGAGTLLFGRVTYEMFESFWPKIDETASTAPDPHAAGRRSQSMRDMGVYINQARKIVFSTTRKEMHWKNSELVRAFDPKFVEALKREPGNDMMIFGSGSIVRELTIHGLIDEYTLVISPLLLGGGRPLFNGLPNTTKLRLIEAKPFASGNVRLRYARDA